MPSPDAIKASLEELLPGTEVIVTKRDGTELASTLAGMGDHDISLTDLEAPIDLDDVEKVELEVRADEGLE